MISKILCFGLLCLALVQAGPTGSKFVESANATAITDEENSPNSNRTLHDADDSNASVSDQLKNSDAEEDQFRKPDEEENVEEDELRESDEESDEECDDPFTIVKQFDSLSESDEESLGLDEFLVYNPGTCVIL